MSPYPRPIDPTSRALIRTLYRLTVADQALSRTPAHEAPRFARRRAVVEALWDRAPFVPAPPTPVPAIAAADFTHDRFVELSDDHRRPVVIRGFGADSVAVRDWSMAHLAERSGATRVTAVEVDPRPDAHRATRRRVMHDVSFAEFVERADAEPLYVHNSHALASAVPDLLDELGLDRVRSRLAAPGSDWDPIFDTGLFIGSGQVFSGLHCAPGGNFFMQVAGRKTWTLVDPALSPYLFPVLARPFLVGFSGFGTFRDVDEASMLHRVPRLQVTLEPGDVLYNAPWWWHEVINDGHTIGCAMRHVSRPFTPDPTWRNHRLFSAISVYPRLRALALAHYAAHRGRALLGRPLPGTMRGIVTAILDRDLAATRGRRAR